MSSMRKSAIWAGAALALLLAGCASRAPDADLSAQAEAMIRQSFVAKGIAGLDRLEQDEVQRLCSGPTPPSEAQAERLQHQAMATVKWPSDGRFLGDWREGEKLAQSGRGMTWTDASAAPAANGGSCYNCHQLGKAELSYGTIGPSLYGYGRQRSFGGADDPRRQEALRFAWAKLWNSKASQACSAMPRFGHTKLLDEGQIRHLMALLFDPQSPVNQ